MPTVKERILELSPLGTGTVAEHLMAITLGYSTGSDLYEVVYVPSEDEEIHYAKMELEVVEFLSNEVIEVVYELRQAEIILVPNKEITIEFVPLDKIDINYEDTGN